MTISEYLSKINKRYLTGISREHSYRGDLQTLLETLCPDVLVTNEPARVACGAPDYVLTRREIPIGYIEAKDIGDSDLLGKKANKEQFNRYKNSLDNLVFTDYLRFHFYKNGELVETIELAVIDGNTIVPQPEAFERFTALIKDFATYVGQTIRSSSKLSKMMAGKAKMLAQVIAKAVESDEENDQNSTLKEQMNAFKQILIHDIKPKEFADIYAQTIAYGMFAARLHDETLEDFSRQEAANLIPKSNPFLRKLFQYISGYDIDDRIEWIVTALADIFRATDVRAILNNFGKATQSTDPIIHFYEDFLAEYDPKLRKARGVWYTPEPVVKFIVRAVDHILKAEFGISQGLADNSKTTIKLKTVTKATSDRRSKVKEVEIEKEMHRVQILDPATGTGTFLAEVINFIYHNRFKTMQGVWSSYVENDLIPRLNGFELLMASYAMAHLKLDLLLTDTGFNPTRDQRLRVYLTNSLEESHPDTGTLFASWLSSEANEANHIKRDTPVMCVIGNPPYSGESKNKGEWITELMKDYKKEPGGKERLKEQNSKWLNDDYVKFIRFAQYFVDRNGEGIVAYINPHGFLDNPTFRGMRWSLLSTFDKIYTIDLHGNVKKKEVSPDGSPDANVFDIEQGVSINLFIKRKKKQPGLATVFHFDLFGTREEKYHFLTKSSIEDIPFVTLPNKAPMYFMMQRDIQKESTYLEGFSLKDLFLVSSIGIVTARDKLTIKDSKEEVFATINEFSSLGVEEARQKFALGKDVRDWKVTLAQRDILDSRSDVKNITRVSYRPFDQRWTYYTGNSKGFHCMPRGKVMRHFNDKDNIGLVFRRQQPDSLDLYVFCSSLAMVDGYIRSDNKGGETIAPLYIYPDNNKDQFVLSSYEDRLPNLKPEIVEKFSLLLKQEFTLSQDASPQMFRPIDIWDYIYGVLHCPAYRTQYAELLKVNYPRVPYPATQENFWRIVNIGAKLRSIHLLESSIVEDYITTYPEDGDNIITTKIGKKDWELYDKKNGLGRIWINDAQYFDKVPLVAWEFYIGGYQPAQKWLKDRKERTLSFDDILHYQKIIVALMETDRLMKEIDEVGVEW